MSSSGRMSLPSDDDPEKQPVQRNVPAADGLHRFHSQPATFQNRPPQSSVNYANFAGRLGGNQLFILDKDDSQYAIKREQVPDAVPCSSWSEIMDLRAFGDRRLWEMATLEGAGTMLLVWSSALLGQALVPYAPNLAFGPVPPVAIAVVNQFITISIFVFAFGPITGAHLNPLITMGTFLVRLSSLARTVLYVSFQCIGAIIGAWLVRASLGGPKEQLVMIPGCYIDSSLVTPGSAFALETVSSLLQLMLAFGLGLDPRNNSTFGPSLGPFLIGLSAAITLFPGAIARPGYLGSSNNPARCLGLNTASGRWTYHYINWTGDITAAVINGILYEILPPINRKKSG